MKIEISEQPTDETKFPSFWKDGDGDLWFWVSGRSGVCISSDTVHDCNERNEVDFKEYYDDLEFVRVRGTITITV